MRFFRHECGNRHSASLVRQRSHLYMNNMMKLPFTSKRPRVAVIRMQGMIATGDRAPLNDAAMGPLIERAFRKGKPQAVALVVNSPGGSPVQSSLIAARVRRLADEKKVPVHAFVEDVAASGGYWLAAAADDIYADPASIIGSIGVISAGFGAHELLNRHGVERRVYTSVKSKSMLDPFLPEKAEDVERLKEILGDMHAVFEGYVKDRRGARLTDDPDLFTGRVWMAEKAQALGLIDGVGHVTPKLKEIYGDKVRFMVYGRKRGWMSRFGMQFAQDAAGLLEERAAYARFGL
ncbi:putative protease SohB [Thalassovita mediterranea]|uniref:Putative protease SohB n=3 Tax=Thalassovita mediterranea TaxID=340021 RepID=A0A0P1H3U8_9RHOB|nr:putative protease SohB [Thalassovita mediterranea]SIS34401.1 serine protease SohB [Thalassovita mediterranea]